MRLLRTLAFSLMALIAAFILTVEKSTAADSITLMLDWFVNPDHGPVIIADREGFFAEQGLEVKIQEPADPSLPLKLAAAGEVDLAVSYQPQLTMAASEGIPVAWAGTLVATPLNTVTFLEKGPIKSLADLKGKKIGYSIPGLEEAVMSAMLSHHKLSLNDVTMINVGWNLSTSLMSGQVDAIVGGFRNFELNQLALEGKPGRAFFPEDAGVPPYDELIFVANNQTKSLDKIQRFLVAIEQGAQFITNHSSEESWTVFVSYNQKQLDTPLNRQAWPDTLRHFAHRPAAVDFGRYQRGAEFLLKQGVIKKAPDLKKHMLAL